MEQTLSPTAAVQPMFFCATQIQKAQAFKNISNIQRALDELVAGTGDLLLALKQLYPSVWQQLVEGLNVSEQEFIEQLERLHPTKEPQKLRSLDDERKPDLRFNHWIRTISRRLPWSVPVLDIQKQCNREAKDTRKLISEIRILELILERDCDARNALLAIADEGRVREIIAGLKPSPDVPTLQSIMASKTKANMRALGQALPEGYLEIEEPSRLTKPDDDFTFPEHPAESKSEPMPEDETLFDSHLESWLNRAIDQAKARNATSVTFDHLFLCLLEDGTEVAGYLDSKNINRKQWAEGIDILLTKNPTPPDHLGVDKSFAEAIPEDGLTDSLPEVMEKLRSPGLSEAELTKKTFEHIRATKRKRPFTDLLWLEKDPFDNATLAWALLRQHGIYPGDMIPEPSA